MKSLWRSLARSICDYDLYRIYCSKHATPTQTQADGTLKLAAIDHSSSLTLSTASELRRLRDYAGNEAQGFGAWLDGELAGSCWYWWGSRYLNRNFWPLSDGEAKLVQITVAAAFRRRGVATRLVEYSAAEMMDRGFSALYARIWHSHTSSMAVFEKAGWAPLAFVAEVAIRGLSRPLRVVRPAGPDGRWAIGLARRPGGASSARV
jgi:GNAT superfamily N-acetyltransferase